MSDPSRQRSLRQLQPGRTALTARRARSRVIAFAAALVLQAACLTSATLADAVKLGGFWINDVTVDDISDEQLIYVNRMGLEDVKPLASVQGLKITAYPELAQAQDAIDAGNEQAAAEALVNLRATVREDWLRNWVSYLLIGVYDRAGQPIQAVEAMVDLAGRTDDGVYFQQPPTASIQAADGLTQKTVNDLLIGGKDFVSGANGEAALSALLELVDVVPSDPPTPDPFVDPVPPPAVQTVPDTRGASRTDPDGDLDSDPDAGFDTDAGFDADEGFDAAPDAGGDSGFDRDFDSAAEPELPMADDDYASAQSVITVPRLLDTRDEVTRLLISGKFQDALSRVEALTASDPSNRAMRLYQRGLAQLGFAETSGDHDAYLDAGLSFMRVVTQHPRTRFAGPSLLEAAVVNGKLGRADIARRLLARAGTMIDVDEDPRYAQRLSQMSSALTE